ncbi:unnamed protein product, partial [Ectocarpus fasciculatus]
PQYIFIFFKHDVLPNAFSGRRSRAFMCAHVYLERGERKVSTCTTHGRDPTSGASREEGSCHTRKYCNFRVHIAGRRVTGARHSPGVPGTKASLCCRYRICGGR